MVRGRRGAGPDGGSSSADRPAPRADDTIPVAGRGWNRGAFGDGRWQVETGGRRVPVRDDRVRVRAPGAGDAPLAGVALPGGGLRRHAGRAGAPALPRAAAPALRYAAAGALE